MRQRCVGNIFELFSGMRDSLTRRQFLAIAAGAS